MEKAQSTARISQVESQLGDLVVRVQMEPILCSAKKRVHRRIHTTACPPTGEKRAELLVLFFQSRSATMSPTAYGRLTRSDSRPWSSGAWWA